MFVILAYDVNAKRCHKYERVCSKYLIHKQNSLFEGYISEGLLNELIVKINKFKKEDDRLVIYSLPSKRYFKIINDFDNDYIYF